MIKIKLVQEPFLDTNGDDYHDYCDDSGNLTQEAIDLMVAYYSAIAKDDEGYEYIVMWKIKDLDAFNRGDECDCCEWDEPCSIYSYKDNKLVKAEIIN